MRAPRAAGARAAVETCASAETCAVALLPEVAIVDSVGNAHPSTFNLALPPPQTHSHTLAPSSFHTPVLRFTEFAPRAS